MSSNEQLVPVEQIDREAAANLASEIIEDEIADNIRKGIRDRFCWVQAFARHRLAALRTPPAVEFVKNDDFDALGLPPHEFTDKEIIEKVAREICVAAGDRPDETQYQNPGVPNWVLYDDFARAAIGALRKAHAPAVKPDEGLSATIQKVIAEELYGPDFDPFTNPEMSDWFEQIAKAVIAAATPSIRAQALDEAAPLKFEPKLAKEWWQEKMPNSQFVSASLMGDGYVKIFWRDDDESGKYGIPWVTMSRDLGALKGGQGV